jgi:hypothetical protein
LYVLVLLAGAHAGADGYATQIEDILKAAFQQQPRACFYTMEAAFRYVLSEDHLPAGSFSGEIGKMPLVQWLVESAIPLCRDEATAAARQRGSKAVPSELVVLLCALLRTLLKAQLAADPPSKHEQLQRHRHLKHVENSNLLLWTAGMRLSITEEAARHKKGSSSSSGSSPWRPSLLQLLGLGFQMSSQCLHSFMQVTSSSSSSSRSSSSSSSNAVDDSRVTDQQVSAPIGGPNAASVAM